VVNLSKGEIPMAEQTFAGRTEDVEGVNLDSTFWRQGRAIVGRVKLVKMFNNERSYVIELDEAVGVDGQEETVVAIGNLSGFKMALQAARLDGLRLGDRVTVECTGFKKATKEGYSDRINFAVSVKRAG